MNGKFTCLSQQVHTVSNHHNNLMKITSPRTRSRNLPPSCHNSSWEALSKHLTPTGLHWHTHRKTIWNRLRFLSCQTPHKLKHSHVVNGFPLSFFLSRYSALSRTIHWDEHITWNWSVEISIWFVAIQEIIFLVITDADLVLINRQTSAESSASGSVSSGQHVVYEAICGKTGGSDATLHML